MNGNALDLSGNGNHGIVSNASLTKDRFGIPNKAYRFNRILNSRIEIRSLLNIAPNNELTISMWAKAYAVTSNCLFVLNPDNQTDRCVGCARYANNPTMMIWDYGDILSGGRSAIQNIPIDTSNWHHYVFIISQTSNSKKTYLDGMNNLNTNYTSTCSNKNFPLWIGGGFSNGTSSQIMWEGLIDDVIIYNRALSSNEVTALYSGAMSCGMFTGLEDLKQVEDFVIFPSVSSSGTYVIQSNILDQECRIEICSVEGKLIKRYTGIIEMIDISEAMQGLYFVKFVSSEGCFIRKIIKQ